MKPYRWDQEKDEKLRVERGVSFVEVLASIYVGGLLDDIVHPHLERYPGQRIMVINIKGYVYLVPYVENSEYTFLKTIIPSRRMTRKYLRR